MEDYSFFRDYLNLMLKLDNTQLGGLHLDDLLDRMDVLWRNLSTNEKDLANEIAERLGIE